MLVVQEAVLPEALALEVSVDPAFRVTTIMFVALKLCRLRSVRTELKLLELV